MKKIATDSVTGAVYQNREADTVWNFLNHNPKSQ